MNGFGVKMVQWEKMRGTITSFTDFSQPKGQASLPEFSLSEESRHVIKDILQSKSRDGNGVIDVDELGDCLEAFGFNPDDEDVDFLKAHFDDNGDGELEVNEIMDNIDVINWHCFHGKELMDEFIRIDRDKDRFIRFPEMLSMLTTHGPEPLPPKEARQLLDKLARKYDENFDGKFSYAEFVKIYMSDDLPFKNQLEAGIKPSETKAAPSSDKKPKKRPVKKKSTVAKDDVTSSSTTNATSGTNSANGRSSSRPLTSRHSSNNSSSKTAVKSRTSDLAGKPSSGGSRTSTVSSRASNGSAQRTNTGITPKRSVTKT